MWSVQIHLGLLPPPAMSPSFPLRGKVHSDLLLRLELDACPPEFGQEDGEHAGKCYSFAN